MHETPTGPTDPQHATSPGAPTAYPSGAPHGGPDWRAPTDVRPATPDRPVKPGWWVVVAVVAGACLVAGGVAAGVVLAHDGDRMIPVAGVTGPGPVEAAPPPAAADAGASSSTGTGAPATTAAPAATAGSGSGTGTGTAWVRGSDDIELFGDVLERASAAALALGDGDAVVTAAERSDDPTHTYEIEIGWPDGTVVDVYLDAGFAVVAQSPRHVD